MPFPLDSLYLLVCGGRFTTLNGNPTVFTGPALDMTAGAGTAVGTVALATPVLVAGAYFAIITMHTLDRYGVAVDTSNVSKSVTVRDNAALAEGIVSFFALQRQQPV